MGIELCLRTASLAALAALTLFGAASADAQPIEQRARVGLEATPLALINTTSKANVDLDFDGANDELDTSEVHIGLAPGLGLNIGYGASEHVVVGGRLQLIFGSSEQQDTDVKSSSTTVLLMPYAMFVGGGEGDSIRFTAAGSIGYGRHRSDVTSSFNGITADSAQTATGVVLGASIGFLAFAADRFSIDPAAFVFYETGGISFVGEDAPDDVDYSGTTIGISVTFSGWLGGYDGGVAEPQRPERWASTPEPREHVAYAPPAPRAAPAKATAAVLTTRTTLDSAVFMLLGSPEQRGSEVALRIQRYAPSGEAACEALDIEIDGAVVRTVPLKQQAREDHGVQELTVQAAIDLELAERMAKSPSTKLRWCGNERTLSLVARDGISRFIVDMRARLAKLPKAEPPPAAPVEAVPAEPAPAEATPPPAAPAPAPN